jgi:hypothetical protein
MPLCPPEVLNPPRRAMAPAPPSRLAPRPVDPDEGCIPELRRRDPDPQHSGDRALAGDGGRVRSELPVLVSTDTASAKSGLSPPPPRASHHRLRPA